jgi:hypothetical protein
MVMMMMIYVKELRKLKKWLSDTSSMGVCAAEKRSQVEGYTTHPCFFP